MANDMKAQAKKWPTEIGTDEDLYAVVDDKTNEVKYLVFTSINKQAMFVRDNGSWLQVSDEFIESIDDPDLSNEEVDINFIDYFDSKDKEDAAIPFERNPSPATLTAAAEDKCPPATTDIAINLRNRKKAITTAGYGPLNPEEPNDKFWDAKAELWSVTAEDAKKSLCGNCAVFVVTTKMKGCIAEGLAAGDSGLEDAWDSIDQAELGYCESFDFKCAASRTCDAWVAGGPISDDIKSDRGAA
jgi:hypothetical protein